jgi:methylglutaconyl-CoA hydratase
VSAVPGWITASGLARLASDPDVRRIGLDGGAGHGADAQSAPLIRADQAHALGFVHALCSSDELDAKVDDIVTAIVDNGPMATRSCKRLVQDMAGLPITPQLRQETARRIADIRASDEGREGVQAFLNKRKPSWLADA